jgi:glycosyltransferase involved in cell wall biosynthesis
VAGGTLLEWPVRWLDAAAIISPVRHVSVNRRKLRVLTLLDNPDVTGGGERLAVTAAMTVDPNRFDRYLCATRAVDGPTFEPDLRAAGVQVLTLRRESKTDLNAWEPLVSLVRRERIDVLHAHKFGSNVWGALFGTLLRIPVVVAHEQSWASARYSIAGERLRAFLDREIVGRGADVFIAVSHADRQRMIAVEGIDSERVRVLWNAVPTPRLTGNDVRAELGIPAGAPVVGTVCQLRPEKALDLLVAAAGILKQEFPELRVLIAGDGAEEGRLRAQIESASLDETVLLLGTRQDVPDVLAAVDVAVCCSDFEGTPLSVMEYMGAGRPVVATDVGGLPELIDHDVTGLLFERRNAEGLAGALGVLLRDPERRAAMGARARRRQLRDFHLEAFARRLEGLYEDLYRASPRGRAERWAPVIGEA